MLAMPRTGWTRIQLLSITNYQIVIFYRMKRVLRLDAENLPENGLPEAGNGYNR